MYFFILIVCVNTRTSMIKTNACFGVTDFQAARVRNRWPAPQEGTGVWRVWETANAPMPAPKATTAP